MMNEDPTPDLSENDEREVGQHALNGIGSPETSESSADVTPSAARRDWQFFVSRSLIVVGGALTLSIGLAGQFDLASSRLATAVAVLSLLSAAAGAILLAVLPKPSATEAVRLVFLTAGFALVITSALYSTRPGPPPPEPMNGEFNIAVSEFVAADGGDDARVAAALSDSLHAFLSTEAKEWGQSTGDDVRVRSPVEVGKIDGDSEQQRAESAHELAASIDADLVIYGRLTSDRGVSTFVPSFVLNSDRLDGAQELFGEYDLGAAVVAAGTPADSRKAIRQEMEARTGAFAHFVIGLVQYRTGDHEEAARYFELARDEQTPSGQPAWPAEDGRELVHLFLGNALAKDDQYDKAEDEYRTALALADDRFARAWVGLAELARSRARCTAPGTGDAALLDQAAMNYGLAMRSTQRPLLSYVEAKSEIGLGKVSYCRSDFEGARHHYEVAIESLGGAANARDPATDRTVLDLLGESYLGRGIATVQTATVGGREEQLASAIEDFTLAVEFHYDLERRALAHGWLGWSHHEFGRDASLATENCAAAKRLGLEERALSDLCGS